MQLANGPTLDLGQTGVLVRLCYTIYPNKYQAREPGYAGNRLYSRQHRTPTVIR